MINLVVSTIFSSKEAKRKYEYDWSLVENHSGYFNFDYSDDDARVLLQLSMMVTNTNFEIDELSKGSKIIPSDNFSSNLPSWLTETRLDYDSCPLDLISKGIPNSHLNRSSTLCRILYNHHTNVVLIIFTGTSNGCLAALDLDYLQSELSEISHYTPGLRGHKGMYNAYKSIRSRLIQTLEQYREQNPQIVITGHSLGGALSTLCALDLAYYNPIHYAFASPLFFNDIGSKVFEKVVPHSYRIINLSDMVTSFPLPIMPSGDLYCHVGAMVPFQRNLGEYHRNHALSYMIEYNLTYNEVEIKNN